VIIDADAPKPILTTTRSRSNTAARVGAVRAANHAMRQPVLHRLTRLPAGAVAWRTGSLEARDMSTTTERLIVYYATALSPTNWLEPLIKVFSWIGVAALAIAVLVVGSCTMKVQHYNSSFLKVHTGDTEDSAIARLGVPSYRERAFDPYLRYTGTPCVAPCVSRLWWEWPIMPGIEAWSIEVDQNRTVLKTYRWTSP